MSKHMKKLISTLLCGAMLLSSMSGVFAEGTDAAATETTTVEATAEATAAPEATAEATEEATADAAAEATTDAAAEATTEATAAPEATVAPTVAPTTAPAAADEYFDEAIGLLSVLKIFEGYEDGSIKPESTITRAEMAAVILRTLGNKTLTKYTGMFTDVDASHWAADTIQTAADLGIINGMGDGTFAPDAPVKYEQAIKMTVCALNYGAYADYNGGYPMGYLTLAARNDLKLTKSIGGALGQDASRGTVVKLIYNALNAPYPTLTGFDAQGPIYSTADDKTLASEKHKVYISEGILTGTANKSIDVGTELLDSQIAIDGDVFESTITNADELVGQYVKSYYYDPTGNGGEEVVIYSTPVLNKNNTLVIDALQLDEITNLYGSQPKVKYYSTTGGTKKKTADLVESPVIVYNNEVLTDDKLPATPEGMTDEEYLAEFVTPKVGSVKLGDFNDDGDYDIMFVEKYLTMVVSSSSTAKVSLEYPVEGIENVDMDLDDSQYKIDLTRDGEVIKPRHLKATNVLSVMVNAPYFNEDYSGDKKIKAVATTASFTGTAKSYDEDEDGNYTTVISGEEYYVDENAVKELEKAVGSEATFYLDQFDRIAYIEKAGAGKLTGSEKYGWIMNVYTDYGDDAPTVKLFTQDGTVAEYEVDSSLDYWDKTTGEAVRLDTSSDEGKAKLLSLKTGDPYVSSYGAVRLCKYKTTSDGLLKKLYIATTTDSEDGVTVNTQGLNGWTSIGSILNGYRMSGQLLRFTVPSDAGDMASEVSSYNIDTVDAANYLKYEGGIAEDYIIAEFEDNKPTVMIKYVGSSDALAVYTDTDTAADASIMMVSKILPAVNDEDEKVYIIKGYVGAGEVSFTTNKSTLIYDMSPAEAANPKEDYTSKQGATGFWNGKMDENLADYLKPGDIVGIHGNAYVRFVSVDNVANDVIAGELDGENQFYGTVRKSDTRDNIRFGSVFSIDIDGSAIIDTADEAGAGDAREVLADSAIMYAEVTLKSNGNYSVEVCDPEDALQVFDIEEFDMESKTGDFMLKRIFKNGADRETYIIRFVD